MEEEKQEGSSIVTEESVEVIQQDNKPCRAIVVQGSCKRPTKEYFDVILEEIKQRELRWNCIVQQRNNLIFFERSFGKLLSIQSHDRIVLLSYQDLSSTESSVGAGAVGPRPCECFNSFSTLRDILNAVEDNKWVCFWMCHGRTFVSSIGEEKTIITADDFNQLDTLVGQLIKYDLSDILYKRIPLGETENMVGKVITSDLESQEDFFKDLNELVHQKRKALKSFNTFLVKHCGNIEVVEDTAEDTTENVGHVESPRGTVMNDDLRAIQRAVSIPVRTLLQCIAVRLTPSDWDALRRYVGRDIPSRVAKDLPSNIEFFVELENRDMIQTGNTDYIRNGLYDIERVDLVHLLDCIQDGDFSLLTADQPRERWNRNEGPSAAPPVRQVQTSRRGGERSGNAAGQGSLLSRSATSTQSPLGQVLEFITDDGRSGGTSDAKDRRLQRRYQNVPRDSAPSYPVQEQIREEQPVGNGTDSSEEGTGARGQSPPNVSSADPNSSSTGTNSQAASTPIVSPEVLISRGANAQDTSSRGSTAGGVNVAGTVSQGSSAEGATAPGTNAQWSETWVQNARYSCEHYDRYCLVKFACCERFWPCHRCHNAKGQCGSRKLKSRDIAMVKCRRCNKEQPFPETSAHCIECNLKFAEYFCPICQHLTGVQNHPFHCAKCGICRVRGDRSFHCDVCGVCLDVNLRDNHQCREGSAHDVCVVCRQDAFTGCQLLACGHKVHKECAARMLKDGVKTCPACSKRK